MTAMLGARRRLVLQARDVRRSVRLARREDRRIGYVGWVGHGNVGDEASFEAYRRAFPSWMFWDVPSARLLRVLDALTPRALVRAVALGGGTLIGWPHFRHTVTQLLASDAHVPLFMLGTGVEDPEFDGRNPLLRAALERATRRSKEPLLEELARWTELFARMPLVAVRGPRSQEVLAEIGIAAQVVGDPALLLADDAPSKTFHEHLLGLNIGRCEGLWGDDVRSVIDAVIELAQAMRRRGWTIRLVPLSPADVPPLREVARAVADGVQFIEGWRNVDVLRASLRDCHVFVGQKLHSIVLATTAYVPTVALEYHPKCADFQRSLGREHFVVRTDALQSAKLADLVDDLARRRDDHTAALVAAVAELRQRQAAACDRVSAALARAA